MKSRWTADEKIKLIALYSDTRLSIAEIAVSLGRSKQAIHNMLAKLGIANRCKKLVMPAQVTPEEARIHAHVCGDGSLGIAKRKRGNKSELEYEVTYTNKDSVLLNEFKADVKSVYNRVASQSGWNVKFSSKRVFERLKELGAGDSHTWYISDQILESQKDVKRAWIRAFWDDEGTVGRNGLLASSVNHHGLSQVCDMMRSIGVPAHITGPYRDKTSFKWHLRVNKRDVASFAMNIGFNSPQKLSELMRFLHPLN